MDTGKKELGDVIKSLNEEKVLLNFNLLIPNLLDLIDNRYISFAIFAKKFSTLPYIFEDWHCLIMIEDLLEELKNKFFIKVLYKIELEKTAYNSIVISLDNGIIIDFGHTEIIDFTDSLGYKKELRKKILISDSYRILHIPEFEKEYKLIRDIIKKHTIDPSTNKGSNIGIIARDSYGNGYTVNMFDLNINLDENFYNDMDLCYGDGFTTYFYDLVKLIETNHKGLILFHGEPGTGKSFCIRHLIRELTDMGKIFIYLPNDLITNITEPDFLAFIIEKAVEEKHNKKNIILVVEDAEVILKSRDNGDDDNYGISNLLNLSDGILNDILHFQIIATFNTDLNNLDSAILRSGRLISRKNFNKLNVNSATKLINKLGLDIEPKDNMSLSDIYSHRNKNDILLHGVEEKVQKEKLGFI